MPEQATEAQIDSFVSHIALEFGRGAALDSSLSDGLGRFVVDAKIELDGVSYVADVEFDLTSDGVVPMRAEISIDRDAPAERLEMLRKHAAVLDEDDDEFLFEYRPERDQLDPDVLETLDAIHEDVFG